jgi:hypothetical protein
LRFRSRKPGAEGGRHFDVSRLRKVNKPYQLMSNHVLVVFRQVANDFDRFCQLLGHTHIIASAKQCGMEGHRERGLTLKNAVGKIWLNRAVIFRRTITVLRRVWRRPFDARGILIAVIHFPYVDRPELFFSQRICGSVYESLAALARDARMKELSHTLSFECACDILVG